MQGWTAAAIGAHRGSLLAWLASVDGDAWNAPTACAPWTVKDVLAHLVSGEMAFGRIYRGEVSEHGYLDPESGIADWRALPGVAVRAALWQHGVATQRILEAMSEQTWQRQIRAFGCRRVSQLARLHLFELAVHGHDLTAALDADELWGDLLPFLAEHVMRAAPRALGRNGLPPAGALQIVVPDLDQAWTIDGTGDTWSVSTREATDSYETSARALVLTATGRGAPPEEATALSARGRAILDALRIV